MALPLLITRDGGGYPTTGTQTCLLFPSFTQTFLLTANTALAVTVPRDTSTNMMALFSYTPDKSVFVQSTPSPTITVPTGVIELTTIELNPSARNVKTLQQLQFITPDTGAYVTISYYGLPSNN